MLASSKHGPSDWEREGGGSAFHHSFFALFENSPKNVKPKKNYMKVYRHFSSFAVKNHGNCYFCCWFFLTVEDVTWKEESVRFIVSWQPRGRFFLIVSMLHSGKKHFSSNLLLKLTDMWGHIAMRSVSHIWSDPDLFWTNPDNQGPDPDPTLQWSWRIRRCKVLTKLMFAKNIFSFKLYLNLHHKDLKLGRIL